MSAPSKQLTCTAFANLRLVAQGSRSEVSVELKKLRAHSELADLLVFDDETGEALDIAFDLQPVLESAPPEPMPARPGRPKLGVVAREVTLLPRHWEWLEAQPGGASVALRRLVETARKEHAPEDRARRSIEAAYRFLSVMCGNMRGFEETARALFRRDWPELDRLATTLPRDIEDHLRKLTANARPELPDNAEH